MRPTPIPGWHHADVGPHHYRRVVFAAPDGDLTSTEVAPLEVLVAEPAAQVALGGMHYRSLWTPDAADLDALELGGLLELVLYVPVHPVVSLAVVTS